jgi:hypothetical protein
MSLAAAAIIVGLSRAGIAIYRHVGTK